MNDCIFCKIAKREVPKDFTYEDEEIMVFPDISPIKPVHLLAMPKKHIKELLDVEEGELFGKLMKVIQKMVKENGLDKKGYHLMVNGGGAQIVDHFHVHVVGPIGQSEHAHNIDKRL